MKGAILNYENRFYLNNTPISGITSIDGDYTINYSPINTIGVGYNKQVISEVPVCQFGINRYLVYNEPFLNYTGETLNRQAQSFRGSINYQGKSIGFESGYLMSFNVNCAVGEIPKTSSKINIFGDIGKGYSASGNFTTPYISVPQVKDITITCSGSSTNRITSFDYSINCPKKPVYIFRPSGYLNSEVTGPIIPGFNYIPYEVLSNLPIEVDATFDLEVDDYETKRLYDQLNNDINSSFSINIKGTVFQDETLMISGQDLLVGGGNTLLMYKKSVGINLFDVSFDNAKLVSQQITSSADDILSVKLNYRAYLNN